MNNKGFAITGIIYTLFIIFLMVLLSVLSGLKSYQRLMTNSISGLESSFEGVKLSDTTYDIIADDGTLNYSGKYVFKSNSDVCTTYLNKGINVNTSTIYYIEGSCSFTISKDNLNLENSYILGVDS